MPTWSNNMAKVVESSSSIFKGRCQICKSVSEEEIRSLATSIVLAPQYSFVNIDCPACGNLMALYPQETFEKFEILRKTGLQSAENTLY